MLSGHALGFNRAGEERPDSRQPARISGEGLGRGLCTRPAVGIPANGEPLSHTQRARIPAPARPHSRAPLSPPVQRGPPWRETLPPPISPPGPSRWARRRRARWRLGSWGTIGRQPWAVHLGTFSTSLMFYSCKPRLHLSSEDGEDAGKRASECERKWLWRPRARRRCWCKLPGRLGAAGAHVRSPRG